MIAYTTKETTAFHLHIYRGRHIQFDTAQEGVDIYFLILGNRGLAQVETDSTAECIKAGTVKGFTMIDILIAAIMN